MPTDTRNRLLAAAIGYYASHGVRDTSLRTLAAAIGTSQRMLHYHFGSRDDLLAAVIQAVVAGDSARVDALTAADGDPFERGRENWRAVRAEAAAFGPLFFELAAHAMQGLAYAEPLRTELAPRTEAAFARAYADLIDPARVRVLARLSTAVGRGLLFEALLDGDQAASDAAMEEYIAMVRGVLGSQSQPQPMRCPRARTRALSEVFDRVVTGNRGDSRGAVMTAQQVLAEAVEQGVIPGGLALVDRAGQTETYAVGSWALDGPPADPDAIVRIQSMTKPITAAATLRLIEAGRLRLDDPVDRWLPELADRRVLRAPDGPLTETVPATRAITVRDLLTNGSGYGMDVTGATPYGLAMRAAGVEAGPEPVTTGAEEWLAALATLPLAHQPGEGFRYHHSFAILGILLSRVAGRPLQEHLAEDVFGPLGMVDTVCWVPPAKAHRLPPAYRHDDGALVQTEPAAGGGIWVGPPPVDVSHNELLATLADLHRFTRMLRADGRLPDGSAWLAPESVRAMTSDQVAPEAKSPESFFPGFWEGTGWGYGVAIQTSGPHVGRYGWTGGQGTDFFIDPATGTIAILLTQVELGATMWPLLHAFQEAV